MILENANTIRRRIVETCNRCGRNRDEIILVAVTKTFGSDVVREAVSAGLTDFGENYVNEFSQKTADFKDTRIRWHYIGHLQRNKVKDVIGQSYLIHSVDSIRLADEISKRAEPLGKEIDILLEVNTSDEKSKFGVRPDDAAQMIRMMKSIPNINLCGLMTIGPFLPDPEPSRPAFRLLREIRDNAKRDGIDLPHLSMGMTNDFEVAIEEGATLIRIGTAIFGKRTVRHNQELSELGLQ